MRVPKVVQSYIEDKVIKTAESAYLEFDSNGLLQSWGGSLEIYGVIEPALQATALRHGEEALLLPHRRNMGR